MKVIDTHCDALVKLQNEKIGKRHKVNGVDYRSANFLDTNFNRLQKGEVKVQFFAIFIYPDVPSDQKWQYACDQIDIFYEDILGKNPEMKHIKNWGDIDNLKEGEIGAVLSLEGADAIGNDVRKLRHLYRLGVLAVGLTWNNANLCADGVGEPRLGGLTSLGKEVVKLNNKNKVLTDVSHISERGFWDTMDISEYPFASHSNAKAICDHPRNLTDEQIKALFDKGGTIHVVFNPPFIKKDSTKATFSDLIKHIDHLCSLGGRNKVGFGSDFDGINHYVKNLRNAANYQHLINELLKYYAEEDVKGFAYQNFLDCRPV